MINLFEDSARYDEAARQEQEEQYNGGEHYGYNRKGFRSACQLIPSCAKIIRANRKSRQCR